MNTVLNAFTHSLSAAVADGDVPEYIHLLPAGTFSGIDGRGPFALGDVAKLIAASLPAGRKLPIDVNHAIDHLSGTGQQAPAVGWIVALEARADGVWGKVEWTADGQSLVAEKKYGFISPVFNALKAKPHRVLQLLRASLTNDPNLTLTALHERSNGEPSMEEELRLALGLPETADQAAILAAVTSAHSASTAMVTIAKAAGLGEDAEADAIVTALQERSGDDDEKADLREQVKQLNTRLTAEVTTNARQRAEAVVEKAIEDGKLVPALRDRFITRHMKDPADVEAEIKLMPSLHTGGLGKRRVVEGDDTGLSDTDAAVCEMMGIDPKEFARTAAEIQKEVH